MTRAKTYAAAALSALFLFLLAPAALAQGVPDVGDVGGTVGDTTGGVTDTVGDTTGGVTDTVGDTTGGAAGTVGDTTGGVTDTVGGTTGGVTDTVGDTTGGGGSGGSGGGTPDVGGTIGTVTDTVGDVTGGSGGGGSGGGGTGGVTGPITDTVGGITGGNGSGPAGSGDLNIPPVEELTPGAINEILDEADSLGLSPEASKGWIEGKKILESASFETPRAALSSFSRVLESLIGTIAESGTAGTPNITLTVDEPEGESFVESASRIATEAAKTLAFPLALALTVVGFLMVQGRIGRKDPKLVMAPVDTTEETLIFE